MTDDERKIVDAMFQHGGSFVYALAEAMTRADQINFAKLRDAFPAYWKHYAKIAEGVAK